MRYRTVQTPPKETRQPGANSTGLAHVMRGIFMVAEARSHSVVQEAVAAFKRRGPFLFLMVCALIVAGVPVLLAVTEPSFNNPVLIALCAAGQFFVSIFAGIAWSKADAVKEANKRWVPMAASACDR